MADIPEFLGKLVPDSITERDAIHFAVIPVQAGCRLSPGQNIGKLADGRFGPNAPNNIGIVDPFFQGRISEDERFYLFLYPNTITGLRHVWSHPAFPAELATPTVAEVTSHEASEAWLRGYCDSRGDFSYETLLYSVDDWGGDDYLVIRGSDASGDIPPEVFKHLEVVLGRQFSRPPTYYSCSC